MKARIHRVAGSRSFIRSLSIVAVAVVAFAALELLHVQPADAGIVCCTNTSFTDCLCDSSLTCSITRNGKFYGRQVLGKTCWNYSSYGSASQIRSTIECEAVNGIGTNEFTQSALLGTTVLDLTSFTQSALLSCVVKESSDQSHIDTRPDLFCQLDISYSRTGLLAQCTNNGGNPATSTLSYSAFCDDVSNKKNPLNVFGTLQCGDTLNPGDLPNWCGNNPDCVLNLGIADQQGKCDDLFPADAVRGLAEGQILSFSQEVEGSFCDMESQVLTVNKAETRYCTGGTFDGAPVDCVSTVGQGRTQQQVLLSGAGTTQNAVSFDVDFSPETLNATCNPNNNDLWRFLILGNQHLDVARIDVSSLKVEGQGAGSVTCGAVSNNNLSCAVKACPDVAAAVKAHTNGNGTADVTVTGRICEASASDPCGSETAIIGEQNVPISGR